MNKHLYLIFCICFSVLSHAQQARFSAWSNNYLQIDSYSGNLSNDAYTLKIDGNGFIQMPTWRISVRLKQPISNGSQIFPADKISLLPTATSGEFNPNGPPTVAQIGMPGQAILNTSQEVFLVPQSQAALYNNPKSNNAYFNLLMPFNLKVEGGAYLGSFTTWSNFTMVLEFRFYDQNNTVLGTSEQRYTLQIGNLSGTPPVTNQISLKVAAHAKNTLLNLTNQTDYVQGAQIIVPNGLIAQSSTDYQLKVKSIYGTFTSQNGNTLPLQTVHMSLAPSTGATATVFPIVLSAGMQKIANGTSTQGKMAYYDIKYATQPNDITLLQAKMEEYSTVLQYEITPQ